MKKLFMFFLLLILFRVLPAGDNKALLEHVRAKLDRVHDYTADIRIKIDVNFLKMKDTKARLLFKKPDKIKLEAKGFAMIPKASFDFSPINLLQKDFLSVYVKEDTMNAIDNAVIKLVPASDTGNIILATLWIDRQDTLISKIEAATRNMGIFTVIFQYGNEKQYGLPQVSRFSFNLKKSGFHHFPVPEKNDQSSEKKPGKTITGKVTIFYSHYKINSGLDDAVFRDETEEELD